MRTQFSWEKCKFLEAVYVFFFREIAIVENREIDRKIQTMYNGNSSINSEIKIKISNFFSWKYIDYFCEIKTNVAIFLSIRDIPKFIFHGKNMYNVSRNGFFTRKKWALI